MHSSKVQAGIKGTINVLYVHLSKVHAGCKGTIGEYYTFTRLRFTRDVKILLMSTVHSLV